jgi:glycosyltransferase involved in cell wall biosynthesis
MPLAIGEAMAMGKLVVATDVGGVRELVGETGAIVPPGDPQALALAMFRGMERSGEERKSNGGAARARIETNFNIDEKADEWEALYRTLLRQDG